MGARHTFEIRKYFSFTLEKECWDEIYIEKLREIVRSSETSDLYAIVLQEGLANICMIRNSMCFVKSRIEKLIPNKGRGNQSQIDKVWAVDWSDAAGDGIVFLDDLPESNKAGEFRYGESDSGLLQRIP